MRWTQKTAVSPAYGKWYVVPTLPESTTFLLWSYKLNDVLSTASAIQGTIFSVSGMRAHGTSYWLSSMRPSRCSRRSSPFTGIALYCRCIFSTASPMMCLLLISSISVSAGLDVAKRLGRPPIMPTLLLLLDSIWSNASTWYMGRIQRATNTPMIPAMKMQGNMIRQFLTRSFNKSKRSVSSFFLDEAMSYTFEIQIFHIKLEK